jgi:hypothetical protein
MNFHLKKQLKDITEDQKDFAFAICKHLMEDTKERIHDMRDKPGSIELETLNFYRLRVMNQIRFILEASDFVESIFKEDPKAKTEGTPKDSI